MGVKVLIVGYGSIGRRHARVLKNLVGDIAVVSSQHVAGHRKFASVAEAVHAFHPDYIVICTATAAHADALQTLKQLGFTGRALVEKPLYAHAAQHAGPYPFPVHIAYQLRFHKLIVALQEALAGRRTLSAHVYVGQHLAQWRPGRDPKDTYSAHRAQGGGVLRDLSHELDLVSHLFGPIEQWQGFAARVGDVTVDSEDAAAFVLGCRRCPVVSLQMNCLDPLPKREWIVATSDAGIRADLIRSTLTVNDKTTTITCDTDEAMLAMHQALLSGQDNTACTLEEGLALVGLIDKVPVR